MMAVFWSLCFRRASAAVNYLKRFHEKKKRGPKPHSLYLDHIIRKAMVAHSRREQHLRVPKDVSIIKVPLALLLTHIILTYLSRVCICNSDMVMCAGHRGSSSHEHS